tara:strand:- start:9 stop:1559 length:1551 start_codon:yes stop_codon:yes gene_type:complete
LESYIAKLKHILPTFLITAISTIGGLLFFRWLFTLQYDIISINEEIWCVWIPVTLPWIAMLVWIRPRFRVLTFKKNKGSSFFQFLAGGTITACLLVSQAYLTTATGKLQKIPTIGEIEKVEKSRYYHLENFSIDKNYGSGAYTDYRTSSRGKYLHFDNFFVFPIVEDTSQVIDFIPKYWYGAKFKKEISNRISKEEKEEKDKAFYDECLEKMHQYEFQSLDHFERLPKSEDKKHYLRAIEARTKQIADDDFVVLEPIREKYEDRNGNKFAWIFGSFGIGLGILLFSLIWPGYSETERMRFLSGKKPEQDDLLDDIKYLIPKDDHFVTSIILDLNILVFISMVFSSIDLLYANETELLQWGANRRIETTGGEWWRLLTSVFLHKGYFHLLLNITGLVIAAIFVEPLLGRKKYFLVYFFSGLCGGLVSIWWYPNTLSLGPSGALFGVYGAIIALLIAKAFPNGGKKGMVWMFLLYASVYMTWGLVGDIDNVAHLGGLLSGALIGLILYNLDNGKRNGI